MRVRKSPIGEIKWFMLMVMGFFVACKEPQQPQRPLNKSVGNRVSERLLKWNQQYMASQQSAINQFIKNDSLGSAYIDSGMGFYYRFYKRGTGGNEELKRIAQRVFNLNRERLSDKNTVNLPTNAVNSISVPRIYRSLLPMVRQGDSLRIVAGGLMSKEVLPDGAVEQPVVIDVKIN